MSGYTNIGDKELNCQRFCIQLANGTKVYRIVCDHCMDCDLDNYLIDYYTDELGNKIAAPDLTGATSCSQEILSYDMEKTPVCYTTNNGITIQSGGELIRVWESSGAIPNPIPIINQLISQEGVGLDLGNPNVSVVPCPPEPSIEVIRVCVESGSEVVSKLLHIVYTIDNGNVVIGSTFFTDIDGTNQTSDEVVVDCPDYQVANSIIVC